MKYRNLHEELRSFPKDRKMNKQSINEIENRLQKELQIQQSKKRFFLSIDLIKRASIVATSMLGACLFVLFVYSNLEDLNNKGNATYEEQLQIESDREGKEVNGKILTTKYDNEFSIRISKDGQFVLNIRMENKKSKDFDIVDAEDIEKGKIYEFTNNKGNDFIIHLNKRPEDLPAIESNGLNFIPLFSGEVYAAISEISTTSSEGDPIYENIVMTPNSFMLSLTESNKVSFSAGEGLVTHLEIKNIDDEKSDPFKIKVEIVDETIASLVERPKIVVERETGDLFHTIDSQTTYQKNLKFEIQDSINQEELKRIITQKNAMKITLLDEQNRIIRTDFITNFDE